MSVGFAVILKVVGISVVVRIPGEPIFATTTSLLHTTYPILCLTGSVAVHKFIQSMWGLQKKLPVNISNAVTTRSCSYMFGMLLV